MYFWSIWLPLNLHVIFQVEGATDMASAAGGHGPGMEQNEVYDRSPPFNGDSQIQVYVTFNMI